jgi:prolyl oligopeptidase
VPDTCAATVAWRTASMRPSSSKPPPPTPVPTLLYAYGGFRISTTPWYWSSAGKLWLEKGGAYAIANIRGGGEFGAAWHAAATGRNRQRNFDDLAAVAQDMLARNLTTQQRLGVFGSSQGGLLAAGTFVQHPDLFAVVVAQVPLTDMLRYTALASNCTWKAEYGDPSDPEMRDIIAQWSPYQNLKQGVKYPKVLFMTSGSDKRIHPGHARKMAARMEELGQPVMYFESSEGPDADARAEQLALTFTYFRRILMD